MTNGYILVLACDLLDDGNTLGPRTISRLRAGVDFAKKHNYTICTAATWSPKHPKQKVMMSVMMVDWLRDNTSQPAIALRDEEEFNTRGEFRKFIKFTDDINCSDRAITSAWWHLEPRAKNIFLQMFGQDVYEKISFVCAEESFPIKLRLFEYAKRLHSKLPRHQRKLVEKMFRSTGLNTSW